MYLYLGKHTVVPCADVVGIFDMETATPSKITKEFLNRAQAEGAIAAVGENLPATMVVCRSETRTRVYLSQISTATLRKRAARSLGLE